MMAMALRRIELFKLTLESIPIVHEGQEDGGAGADRGR